jgi:ureidoacrylate peracid hydrolase
MSGPATIAGLLVVDPYNDFISECGKFWARIREVAERVGCVSNMERVLVAARRASSQVFFCATLSLEAGILRWVETFEDGTWGGTFRDAAAIVTANELLQDLSVHSVS